MSVRCSGWPRRAIPLAVLLLLSGCALLGLREPAFSARMTRATLDNGLTILVFPKPGSPVAATMVWYDVGSKEEAAGETGYAHFLEHMMFKGAGRFGRGDIDRLTQKNGGQNNAFTGTDSTACFFAFPAETWDAALPVLSAQMRGLTLAPSEVDLERGPILRELKTALDEPWNRLSIRLCEQMFGKHGYAHPIHGWEKDILAATPESLRKFFAGRFGPNRAVFVAVGDLDPAEVVSRVRREFGDIPKVGARPATESARRPKGGGANIQFEDSILKAPRILLGFPSCRVGDSEDYALDFVSEALTGGRTGRLHRRLVEKDQLATAVETQNDCRRDPGAFWIMIECHPGSDPERALEAAMDEIEKIRAEGPAALEMERAKNRFRASFVRRKQTSLGLATDIGEFETLAGVRYLDEYIDRMERVTPEQIRAVIGDILDPKKASVGIGLPKPEGGRAPKSRGSARREGPPAAQAWAARAAGRDGAGAGGAGKDDSLPVDARTLPNGLKVFVLPRRELPIVALDCFAEAGARFETAQNAGVAGLTGQMLSEGTTKRTFGEVADAIEQVAGEIGSDATGPSVEVLSKDFALGLELFADAIRRPAFRADDFDRKQKEALSEIEKEEEDPEFQISRKFREIVYGKHPFSRSARGTRTSVSRLTADDCRAWHAKYFVPSNIRISIVGDVDVESAHRAAAKAFGDWAGPAVEFPKIPAPPQAAAARVHIPTEREQIYMVAGHLGISRTDPDYPVLRVFDGVFGTGSGFTDRLSRRIRDAEGLAYTVYATIAADAGAERGTFHAMAGLEPEKLDRVLGEIREEIDRIRSAPPTEGELAGAKAVLLGELAFALETNGRLAVAILEWDRFGLGFDYPAKFRRAVEAVTADDVRRAAEKHLHPDRIVVVTTGPTPTPAKPPGKPTEKPPAKPPGKKAGKQP